MRLSNGKLFGIIDDNIPAISEAPITEVPKSDRDEDQTTYDLLPVIINERPIITQGILDASKPTVNVYLEDINFNGNRLVLNEDGVVQILLGSTITLEVRANNKDTITVDNGRLVGVGNDTINYTWINDGAPVQGASDQFIANPQLRGRTQRYIEQGNKLTINSAQLSVAGTYTCNIENEFGVVESDAITIEVIDFTAESAFLTNLIENPNGSEQQAGWSSNGELLTKDLAANSTLYTQPYNESDFGYTLDMFKVNPSLIDEYNLRSKTVNSLLTKGTYFTRTNLTYEYSGGINTVTAYQDIDLSEIQSYIKGQIYGVRGVKAVFGAYLGNAVSGFLPNRNTVDPARRGQSSFYNSNPRLSEENWLAAGPPKPPGEKLTLYLEEYEDNTLLKSIISGSDQSRIIFQDPWNKYLYANIGRKVSNNSPGDTTDAIILTAQELNSTRFTYGQSVEFNRGLLERLNKRTNKLRVKLKFDLFDARYTEANYEYLNSSDEFLAYNSYDNLASIGTYSQTNQNINTYLKVQLGYDSQTRPITEFIPTNSTSKLMATGLSLVLIPIFNEESITDYYTRTILTT